MSREEIIMEWISVKDRLPEDNSEKLAYDGCIIILLVFIGGIWINHTDDYIYSGVTHWMTLPEPPKE